jgi:hypothetical protein
VAWVTLEPEAQAGRLWLALSQLAGQTGLQPLLQVGADGDTDYRPVYDYIQPHSVALADNLDVATLLSRGWGDGLLEDWGESLEGDLDPLGIFQDYDPWSDPAFAGRFAPYGRQFLGLAPGNSERVSEDEITRAVDAMGSAYLSLAKAARPADILPVIGWRATDKFRTPLPIAAVLRSWEDRLGARLLRIGPGAIIWLLVERPPHSLEAAQHIAAELRAFAEVWIDHRDGRWLKSILDIGPRLVNNPLWGFWWDLGP